MSDRLTLPLETKLDNDGNKYFIAKLKGPIQINCSEGVAFIIFFSSGGEEELQICPITKPKDKFQKKDSQDE